MLHAVPEPMSGVDLAWLRMESATNPMTVVGVLTLHSRIAVAEIRGLLEARLLRFGRFIQFPTQDLAGAHWQTDANFSMDAHVHALVLPAPAGQRELEAAVSDLASTALDPRHPLWQIHVVERYRRGSALVLRFHHCYGDGAALLRVLATLADPSPHAPSADSQDAPRIDSAAIPMIGPALSLLQDVGGGAVNLVSASLHALLHPTQTAALAQQVSAATGELARIATLTDEPRTPLKGSLSARKAVAWATPLPLHEIKIIGRALGCTINDVLLATVAGALGRYARRLGCMSQELSIRALVPVNLRPPDAQVELGNRFGLVFAALPIGERNPMTRLLAVHEGMEALKRSAQPLMSFWLLTALGMLPGVVESQAIDVFTSKATVVISNVPGPATPMYLHDARIDGQHFWVPQAGSIGIGVSLLTYDGHVHFGVMADRNLIADPHLVTRSFAGEFEKLLLCVVSMEPPAESYP